MFVEDTDPTLSIDGGKLGRFYRLPENKTDYSHYSKKDFITELHEGIIFPSITTVLDVLNAPYLQQWAANMASKEAVRVGVKWPYKYADSPEKAYKYLRYLHVRDLRAAADRGTRIHKILELLAQGKPLTMFTLTDDDKACIVAWEKFIKDFQPVFLYQELTGFGKTSTGLKYGGTTDFIANIEGINVAGDYKCSTLDTPILMADGTTKQAGDIKEGDRIVAWTHKRNLHVAKVAWTADNGKHDIVSITTEFGQKLHVTKEHPILVNRKNKLGWVKAADVEEGDFAHLATGWNHNPHRESIDWGYRVSPYAIGVVWAILNTLTSTKATAKDTYVLHENISTVARGELDRLGIKHENNIIHKKDLIFALERNKPENDTTVPFLELFNSANIPQHVFAADVNAQEGFISGVREIFSVRGKNAKECVINLSSQEAIEQLQQLYLNLGVSTQREYSEHETEPDVGLVEDGQALRVPHFNADEIIKHGPIATMITRKKITEAQQTIAIEVEEAHTHVTGGLITHNTTRSGLHNGVALQLTAFKNTTQAYPDHAQPVPTPQIDTGLALHISPEGYKVMEVNTSKEAWTIFESMREMWFYYAFEGMLDPQTKVLTRTLKSPKDLLV